MDTRLSSIQASTLPVRICTYEQCPVTPLGPEASSTCRAGLTGLSHAWQELAHKQMKNLNRITLQASGRWWTRRSLLETASPQSTSCPPLAVADITNQSHLLSCSTIVLETSASKASLPRTSTSGLSDQKARCYLPTWHEA